MYESDHLSGLKSCSHELYIKLYLESERIIYFRTILCNLLSFLFFFFHLCINSCFSSCPRPTNYCKFDTELHLETKINFTNLDMIPKLTNARKCMTVYYTHDITPTCFGHSCYHLQNNALQRTETLKHYRTFFTNTRI